MPNDPNTDWQRLFNPLGQAGQKAAWWDPGGQLLEDPGAAEEEQRKAQLYGQAAAAGGFADQSQQGYGAYGQQAQGYLGQGQGALAALQRQMQGQDSVSALQLRQALGQNQAQQMSMAAGASPQNAAAAARTAAIQSGRLGAGLAGQQAVAGQQERNQATSQFGNLLGQQQAAVGQLRGQDLQAALQSRGQAIQGYGAQDAGQPAQSNIQKFGGALGGVLGAIVASDRRLKTDIKDGGAKADALLAALRRSSSYRYKDEKKHGKGEYVGPMAGDLERAGSRAVINTPAGKMVDGARLATENTAMLAALRDRVAKLEGGRK